MFDDYLGFLEPRLWKSYRVLSSTGSFYFHIDYREVHYCKVLLDNIFGRDCFLNEVIWAYDYGGRRARDTDWITVRPDEPDSWLAPWGGSLRNAYELLAGLGLGPHVSRHARGT